CRSAGNRGPLQPPVKDFESRLEPAAKMILANALSCSVVGSPETVRHELHAFIRRTGADEIVIASQIFEHSARLRSYEIVAQIHDSLAAVLQETGDSPSCAPKMQRHEGMIQVPGGTQRPRCVKLQ